MKAKDYFNQFMTENQDKPAEWRVVDALTQMVLEVGEIAKVRNSTSDSALIAIIKEVEIKSCAFIRLVNETEPFKSEGTIKDEVFRLFIQERTPELAERVWGSTAVGN